VQQKTNGKDAQYGFVTNLGREDWVTFSEVAMDWR
jgi:hypothetical protein